MTARFASKRDNLEWLAVQDCGPAAVERFEAMLAKGESVSTAALLATRKPPGTGIDDRIVMKNSKSVTEQFKGCKPMLELYRRNYKRHTGEDLPEDAVVYRGLVGNPSEIGHPDLIVTNKHSLADVKAAMKKRNAQVEGDWESHPVQQAPEPQKVLISDMAMARYKSEYRQLPEYEKTSEKDLEAEIIHKHTKVVTADDVMNAPRTVAEAARRVFGA